MMKKNTVQQLKLFNTLSREVEVFKPIEEGKIRFYTCGPTVYGTAHLGNLRTYISEDFIRRAMEAAGFQVKHVMNITDVGHLQSDEDEGEDKMAVAARKEKKTPWEVARAYEDEFYEDCAKLHILKPTISCRATDHIKHMIAFVEKIKENGYTYEVNNNVYFSVDQFPDYGKMARLDLEAEGCSRVEVDAHKRNPRDFVLWFSQSKFTNQIMKWDSPWGEGFPGWHVECSTMASHYLGDRVDIHMGGIDHIQIHHTNEIAQSEAHFKKKWVNYWSHCEFLVNKEKKKIAKSEMADMSKASKPLLLSVLVEKGYDPLHYRMFCAGANYRSPLTFSWESINAAREAFETLKNLVISWKHKAGKKKALFTPAMEACRDRFWEAAFNDFNVPKCLGTMWVMARDSSLQPAEKLALIRDFDRLFGFEVDDFHRPQLADEMLEIIKQREAARDGKDWAASDRIRDELLAKGIQLMDTPQGTDWYCIQKLEADLS